MKPNFNKPSTMKKVDDFLESEQELKDIKAEIRRKTEVARKRLKRLEKNNLTDLPAYQQFIDYKGGVMFGVKGKNYNELVAELARVNRFLDSKTSLVRQANAYLKDIANITGVQYGSVKELPDKMKGFFEVSKKVEEYLSLTEQGAYAIGYHKIWEVVNEVVKEENVDLADSETDLEELIQKVIDGMDYEYFIDLAENDWKKLM